MQKINTHPDEQETGRDKEHMLGNKKETIFGISIKRQVNDSSHNQIDQLKKRRTTKMTVTPETIKTGSSHNDKLFFEHRTQIRFHKKGSRRCFKNK